MRITSFEQSIIKSFVRKHFGGNAEVYVFGSRLDNDKKGGDIDLYIKADMSASEAVMRKIEFLLSLEKSMGEQKIDVIINYHAKQKPIYEIAEKEGVKL